MPRILRVDAALYRVSGEMDVVLREPQLLPRCNAYLRLYEVDSGDKLGYRIYSVHSVTGCSTWIRVFISMK